MPKSLSKETDVRRQLDVSRARSEGNEDFDKKYKKARRIAARYKDVEERRPMLISFTSPVAKWYD